jgi:hypothetical protein
VSGSARWIATSAALVTAMVCSTAPAGAATQLGQQSAVGSVACIGPINSVQASIAAGRTYTVPSPGVVTSWSRAPVNSGSGRLQVWQPVGGTFYELVGRSALESFAHGVANEFATQIPVEAGDVLGFHTATGAPACLFNTGQASDVVHMEFAPDAAVGETRNLSSSIDSVRVNVTAILEFDCDGDGLGDETQDADLSACFPDANPPETTITKQPKDKTRKKRATFEFSSSESGASFECSIDGRAPTLFGPCGSPFTVKVKKGRHIFEVRATDAAGNVDPTPATDDWKVKRRKKKRK